MAGSSRRIGSDAETQKEIIAYQDASCHCPLGPPTCECVEQGGEHPGQTNSSEYARNPAGGKIEIQNPAVYEAQSEEDHCPLYYAESDCGIAHANAALLLDREWECHSRDEQEEGEDCVVVAETVPFHMSHLACEPAVCSAWE